jgi:hypothetical protein
MYKHVYLELEELRQPILNRWVNIELYRCPNLNCVRDGWGVYSAQQR